MKYIISTMTDTVFYGIYTPGNDKVIPSLIRQIKIQGGSNIASSTSGIGERSSTEEGVPLWTPRGVITPISDADFEAIKENHVFKIHMDNGHLLVMDKDPGDSPKVLSAVTSGMKMADKAAPLNPSTIATKVSVKTGKVE